MTRTKAIAEIDGIFDRFAAATPAPGVVHARGLGTLQVGVEAPPDEDSVFRIASMTKSFTAAAVLLVRDGGRLRLDDPVSTWVPESADFARATADPWGDRQQSLDPATIAAPRASTG